MNLNNSLKIDKYSWTIFGILWILFPIKLLSINFGYLNYDWITIHITQAFGLLCIFSAIPSYMSLKYNDCAKRKKMVIKSKLIFELVLLLLMIIANNKILQTHLRFGMFGLSICIIINLLTLYEINC
jgi:hypothetical protein